MVSSRSVGPSSRLTGDADSLDAAAYLYVSERVKDVIISGGEEIYPREIEPLAIQFAGHHLDEASLCRIGHTIEQQTDWHTRHPIP